MSSSDLHFKKISGILHPKNAWTLQWKGWNLYSRGPVPQNSRFWGVGLLSCRIYFNLDNQTTTTRHTKRLPSMAGLHIFLQGFVLDHLTDQHIQHIQTTKPLGVSGPSKSVNSNWMHLSDLCCLCILSTRFEPTIFLYKWYYVLGTGDFAFGYGMPCVPLSKILISCC